MELPKNITQIGESNPHCKVYVEDYAISYIKQLNYNAGDKQQAVGLYGRKVEENGITYLFLYGACKMQFLQRESRHLSQAVLLEAEKQRKKYFSEYHFLAYCILQGEMLEGFYICEQGTCRYVEGYAQFFEKNDSMLTFMLADRREEVAPEVVEQEKYEEVKRRQEERRMISEQSRRSEHRSEQEPERQRTTVEKKVVSQGSFYKMRWAVAAVFALLCVTGLLNMGSGEEFEDVQLAVRQAIEALTEQQLPDEVQPVSAPAKVGTIVAEDKLTEALKTENQSVGVSTQPPVTGSTQEPVRVPTQESTTSQTPIPTTEPTPAPTVEPTPTPTLEPTPKPTAEPTPAPVSYTIQSGDTLSAICWKMYGSDSLMQRVCEMNDIDDPDDIKVGDKILLPQ